MYVYDNGKKDTIRGKKPVISFGIQKTTDKQVGGFFTIGNKGYLITEYNSSVERDNSTFFPYGNITQVDFPLVSDLVQRNSFYIGAGKRIKRTGIHFMIGTVSEDVKWRGKDDLGYITFPKYLDNTSVTIDAILTIKGRELLARGGNAFNITQFAVGDDEVDYSLWNPDQPLGTNYYGTIIENMPVTEAIPDETQALKYKLISLPKQTINIPVITVGNTSITLAAPGNSAIISPNTSNFQGGNATLGYTAILSDSTAADIQVTRALQNSVVPTTPRFIGDNEDAQSVAVSGFEFRIVGKTQMLADKTASITIIANETGGSITINLTVKRVTTATQ